MLFIALLIALGFEFVNGFHDTANAVATVIYMRGRQRPPAVPPSVPRSAGEQPEGPA